MKIPFRPLSQYDLLDFVKKLKIPDFRGIYMRDTLPNITLNIESGILNLGLNDRNGTHWTSWYKSISEIVYFDIYGLLPPSEFNNYMKGDIFYSTFNIQQDKKFMCGHCIAFLYEIAYLKKKIMQILLNLFFFL